MLFCASRLTSLQLYGTVRVYMLLGEYLMEINTQKWNLSNFKSRTLENTGIFSVFGASALPFSLIFSLTGENKGKFFYTAPTTLSSSLAEVRLASRVAWA